MEEMSLALEQLASQNYGGAVFLFAYGATWLVCAWLWRVLPAKLAVYATLFQGMIALPAALGVSWGMGMFDQRPGGEMVSELSLLISMSQLLILPLLIGLIIKTHYTIVPIIFSFAGAIHFLPYAWLYQMPVYIAMPILLVALLMILYARDEPVQGHYASRRLAERACLVTGGLFVVTGAMLLLIYAG